MRKLALTLTVALVVGGCSSGTDVGKATSLASEKPETGAFALQSQSVANTGRIAAFANMPDRGALLAYRPSQKPVRRHAETFHAVDLSEAHAFKAAAKGKSIELPLPSGGTMHINYVRHEESLDGNWSWIGRTADGLDAVITFGEKAVFARISQHNTEALRVTTLGGRSWLVETDPSKVLDGNLLRDQNDSDMMIPQHVATAVVAKKRAAAAKIAAGDEAASPANTVDVALGFTDGLVTKYGGLSQANSRLAFLFAITNQGYQNSLITPRVRLVRTVQVSYTDSNTNELALEALTGYTCTTTSCTPQTVPAALVPLRTARDQYGADLVSLVRPFQAPQHDGCGIAWLLGGGGLTIDNTDAPFGYSVVSDGSDIDETDSRNYFCREETLSHELGHNMGQQHNIEDAGSPPDSGTHSYSYGYREASLNGFYTVMAYRLANSSQSSINYFGNPSVTYGDPARATGTATADNARSLNISMPIVAQFRQVVVPFGNKAHNDLNGDGTSDLVWFNTTSFQFAYWMMSNTSVLSSGAFGVPSQFRIVATSDLDGDGRSDLIWRDINSNVYYYWRSRGDGQFDTGLISGVPVGWLIERTTDLNGDGRDDIIWRNAGAGLYATWYMNGVATIGQTAVFAVPSSYSIVATGDLDGDGRGDIVWTNPSISQVYAWRSRGDGTWDYLSLGGYGAGWNIVDAADISGDGRSDLIWENTSLGLFAHWFMNGATTTSAGAFSMGATGRVVTAGDFNADGRADVVIRTGAALALWRSQGTGAYDAPAAMGGAPIDWTLIR